MNVRLAPSDQKNKKFKAVIYKDDKKIKTVHFGDKRYEDFTMHKDKDRKEAYLKRHKKNENWDDATTAGFWSAHALWNKDTLQASKNDITKKFKIRFI